MNIIGIIPARMGSSRFPGKPLAEICSIPMVGHVELRSRMCENLDEVYVATPDREIADYVRSIDGKPVMTLDTHQRASDRAAEAMQKIEKETGQKVNIVVMIQGDEPLVYPEMIDSSVKPLLNDSTVQVVNLMGDLSSSEEHKDTNEIKVVIDLNNNALYFSRKPIPYTKESADIKLFKQVCIIPFRRDFLIKFNGLKPTPLEKAESIDMLRVLEHGYKVRMVYSERESYSVDTREDLLRVEKIMREDNLFKTYGGK